MSKVIIVGGGFGGVKAALELSRDKRFQIQLVSAGPDFQYTPALYRAATGGNVAEVAIPLSQIFAGRDNVEIIVGHAQDLDTKSKTLTVGRQLSYDKLILALGVTTNYFGTPGLDKYSYGIKSAAEAMRLKEHLHAQLTLDHRPDTNYIIVGAGPSGVELAGAMASYLRWVSGHHLGSQPPINIELVEAAPRILPRSPEPVARAVQRRLESLGVKVMTGAKVEAESQSSLKIGDRLLETHTVIWTAGIANNPFYKHNQSQFTLTPRGFVQVDEYLQAAPDVYVIGDNAATAYTGMAQTASHDGVFVAANLRRELGNKKPKTYRPHKPSYVTPVGRGWAVAEIGRLRLYGRLGWLVRRAADWVAFTEIEPWSRAIGHWLAGQKRQEACPLCGHRSGEQVVHG